MLLKDTSLESSPLSASLAQYVPVSSPDETRYVSVETRSSSTAATTSLVGTVSALLAPNIDGTIE